ncbi:MAG TPA: DUF1573 domain-containing protein [Planctomycetota bacterium]
MLCGPYSLTMALWRLGVPASFRQLSSQCTVTSEGVLLTDLERVAKGISEVQARAERFDWENLRRLDGTAVLFVNGNHFVAVDPRESGLQRNSVRIYEESKPARWLTRLELENVWHGETLSIRRVVSKAGGDAPYIEWDSCLLDNGVQKDHSHYCFSFRNVGRSDLVIGDIKKSCGCSAFKIASTRLGQGQASTIEADVDLRNSQGYFMHSLVVKTNDPTSPLCVLRMAGGVLRTRVLSAQRVNLEDLPQGSKLEKEFYVSDPGFEGFQVRHATFVASPNLTIFRHLRCSVSCSGVGDAVHRIGSEAGYKVAPEDYIIRLLVEADNDCPVGELRGEVNVVLSAAGSVSTHKVAVNGSIIADIHAVPGIALVTLNGRGEGTAIVRLGSHAKRGFSVLESWGSENVPMKLEFADEVKDGNWRVSVSISMPSLPAGAEPVESTAFFRINNGAILGLPVTVFRPPQN